MGGKKLKTYLCNKLLLVIRAQLSVFVCFRAAGISLQHLTPDVKHGRYRGDQKAPKGWDKHPDLSAACFVKLRQATWS